MSTEKTPLDRIQEKLSTLFSGSDPGTDKKSGPSKPFFNRWTVLMGFLFLIWRFTARNMGAGSGVMSFGKNKAKIFAETDTRVSFEDVAGIDEAREELEEVVDFLTTPEKFQRLGGRIPKGVLLVGPPGTGKTLLARAVAGEAKVPFFSISGSEFVEMFVGVGAARVRDLFSQAAKQAPCIIFIDELDALGKARGMNVMGGHDEREQTLNQLLVEMDGFDTNKGVIIMAATNRPEILDPALLRPGRLDRQVLVDRPDINGRKAILKIHSKNVLLGADVDLGKIAGRTPGFVGADLANIVNESALLAARNNKEIVESSDFDEAIDRVIGGLQKKNRVMNASDWAGAQIRKWEKEVYLRQKISPYEFDLFINMDHIPSGPQVARIIASAFEQKFQINFKTR